jgi:putative ABC transport system ATP-binding protein
LSDLATYRNKKVGFVLQTFNLIPYLSAAENVMVPMAFGNGNARRRRARAEALLDESTGNVMVTHRSDAASIGTDHIGLADGRIADTALTVPLRGG